MGHSGELPRALAGVPQWCHVSSSGASGEENEFLFLWETHEYLTRRKRLCGLVCRREPQLRHRLFCRLMPVPHHRTVCRRCLLLTPAAPARSSVAEGPSILVLSITLPASVPDQGVLGEGSACSLGSQPYSGGDPSTLHPSSNSHWSKGGKCHRRWSSSCVFTSQQLITGTFLAAASHRGQSCSAAALGPAGCHHRLCHVPVLSSGYFSYLHLL